MACTVERHLTVMATDKTLLVCHSNSGHASVHLFHNINQDEHSLLLTSMEAMLCVCFLDEDGMTIFCC